MHTLQDEIAQTAYEFYETKGAKHGHDLDDWLEAELLVLSRHAGQDFEEPEDVYPIGEAVARVKEESGKEPVLVADDYFKENEEDQSNQ